MSGIILRIDLTNQSFSKEHVNSRLIENLIGGKGFGTWILQNEIDVKKDPFDPLNPLIFSIGPATGIIPGASKYGVFFRSPLTGIYGESYSGGSFAYELKKANFECIIIKGRASKPIYLWLSDNSVEFRDARYLWGLDTYQTEDLIKEELGNKNVKVASIGPAGEHMVKFACISNDYWRQAGRCGAGALMGSKNLKAIAVKGDSNPNFAKSDELKNLILELLDNIKKNPALAETYPRYGTPSLVDITNLVGVFPTEYWKKGQLRGWDKINAEAIRKNIFIKSKACLGCPIGCGKLVEVTYGKYKGTKIEGPEYETIYAFGGLCKINELDAIVKINDVCDRLGLDTISTGNVVSFAIEAYERGVLHIDKPIQYGNSESVLDLIEKIALRQGIGNILAEGVKRASEILGLQEIAVHVKGLEPAGYDPRGLKGMALSYGISSRGACHLRSTAYIFELRGVVDRASVEGKAVLVKEYEDRFAIFDSLILCRFLRDVVDWSMLTKISRLTTGIDFDEKKLRSIAEYIIDESRIFNVKCGISRKDDYLPDRFMKEPLREGPSEGQIISKKDMDLMLNEYYQLRKWDNEGIPLAFDANKRQLKKN
jgi:aldehyde:ferredoxin oxidoreductase